MPEFKGVFPAIVTPMTAAGEFNEAAFRDVMEFNIGAGVHGFWIAGGTGESVLLSDEENNRIAEISADQGGGRVKNIMHVGAPTTARAAQMAEHAARGGVDAICCVAPFFYKPGDDAVVEHLRVVGAAADLPLFVYNLPDSVGYEITPDLMRKIQDAVPQLAGLKHSAPNVANVRAFAKMGLHCLIGSSMLMLPALTIGAAGCVDGPLCIVPEVWVEIWDAYQAGDLKRAEAAQDLGSELRLLLMPYSFQSAAKVLLSERLGIDCGAARPPLLPLTSEERGRIVQEAARFGFTKRALEWPGGRDIQGAVR